MKSGRYGLWEILNRTFIHPVAILVVGFVFLKYMDCKFISTLLCYSPGVFIDFNVSANASEEGRSDVYNMLRDGLEKSEEYNITPEDIYLTFDGMYANY